MKLIALFAVLEFTLLLGSAARAGTLGYWRFEDGSGLSAADSSGNGNPATLNNAAFDTNVPANPVPTLGLPNTGSVALSGSSSYLSVSHAPILNPTASITVEAWVKYDADIAPYAAGIAGRQYGNDNRNSFNLGIRNNNASIFFEITNASGFDAAAELFTGLSTGAWYHLAGTFDGSTIRLFINGQESASTAFSGSIGYAANKSLLIAADNEGAAFSPTFFFPGLVDEVRISDVALEPTQMLVPEPSSAVLLLFGCCCIGLLRRLKS